MNNDTTIGMDLGNKKHSVVAIDGCGSIIFRDEVANTPEAIRSFFCKHKGATVAMETGLCCRWISFLAAECGCKTLVGNARKLAAIWMSKQKTDSNDALMIAKLARADKELFHPVELRDEEHHAMIQLLELRDIAVSQRTQIVNSIRGLCKSFGVFIEKCSAESFHKHLSVIPAEHMWKFRPMVAQLKQTNETVARYDKEIRRYARKHFEKEVGLLNTVTGVGEITACAFVAHISNVDRFGKARDAGAFFGLTPAKDQSGDQDAPRHITKTGSTMMRRLLIVSANFILRDASADSALKRYGLRICERGGKVAKRKAKTAVARKLAVVMLAMLKTGKEYDDRLVSEKEVAA